MNLYRVTTEAKDQESGKRELKKHYVAANSFGKAEEQLADAEWQKYWYIKVIELIDTEISTP